MLLNVLSISFLLSAAFFSSSEVFDGTLSSPMDDEGMDVPVVD
jgi:hypothetical protein